MARDCTICKRPDIDAINNLIGSNVPVNKIVAQKSGLSARTVARHKENCLKEFFGKIIEQKRAGLLASVDEVKHEIQQTKADFPDNPNVRLGIIGKMLDAIEKEAKLTGAYIKDAENPADLKSVAKIVADFRERIKRDADIYAETNGKYGYAMPDDSFVDAEIEKLCRLHKVKPEQLATLDLGGIG